MTSGFGINRGTESLGAKILGFFILLVIAIGLSGLIAMFVWNYIVAGWIFPNLPQLGFWKSFVLGVCVRIIAGGASVRTKSRS